MTLTFPLFHKAHISSQNNKTVPETVWLLKIHWSVFFWFFFFSFLSVGYIPLGMCCQVTVLHCHLRIFPSSSVVKNLPANAGDTGDKGSIPGSERSLRGGNGYSLQYSCLENPIKRGTWMFRVYGVTKTQILSDKKLIFKIYKGIIELNSKK